MSAGIRPPLGSGATLPKTTRQFSLLIILCLVSVLNRASAEILTPHYFNLAEGRKITATATCGEEEPELYCKLVGANAENDDNINVIQGQVCDYCDANDENKRHPPEYAVDGMETWWQSPPLSRGMKYNEINLTIDLGQEFHVAYVYVRMGNSPRPGLWALEKSSDYGKTYKPWQYFSDSQADCETYFGKESLLPITRDDSVICNTELSKIVPLEGGEIPISLLNYRPSANIYFNSSVLQEWTRATNVRLRLLRTKTLLGHLMSVARQDPTVTRRYFYSIKDISIGGRCMCNGHADACDVTDPANPNKLECVCQHNTCGPQCATCCPGYEQKKWRQSQNWKRFTCEPCNCHNHTTECIYDPDIDAQGLSLDIHGRYEGGGVCQHCQHNTEGVNCNKCKPTYYRPYGKKWNEADVCQPCDCRYNYSTGNCLEESGQCECRPEFEPPLCDSCRIGYFGYPDCKPCTCDLNGTETGHCVPTDGKCPCKYNYGGLFCEECADGFYTPECLECHCNSIGSVSPVCDKKSGNCLCKNSFDGRTCDQCKAGFYHYPTCKYCNCDTSGTVADICDKSTGSCLCKEGFGGPRCDQCIPGYYSEHHGRELVCVQCNCSTIGSASPSCAVNGKCTCLYNFGGRQCDQCSPGYYKYPDCLSCNCDSVGAIGASCDDDGQCKCKENFDKAQCNTCREGYYNFPACEECNCDPRGVIASFAGCGSVPAGELCQCKERIQGRICDDCRPLYWNLQQYNPQGCEECRCNLAGTENGIGVCDTKSGQCVCKLSVGERICNECQDGFYNLNETNVFGCTECDCDVGGSASNVCNKKTGQCPCNTRIHGRRCDKPIIAHYFPTLHQFQYEVEDGSTRDNGPVRYDFSDAQFPNYSWKGYATFSFLQNEIRVPVEIIKSSLYRMVIKYHNPTGEQITAKIKIIPDNPSDTLQQFSAVFKPTTTPQFITVSQGLIPSPFVMNPGWWDVTFETNKNLLMDYFVLIPAAYYEATILSRKVDKPCTVGELELCRDFAYPSIDSYPVVKGSGVVNQVLERINNYQQLKDIGATAMEIPLINEDQDELIFEIMVGKLDSYVFLIEYVTPVNSTLPVGGKVTVKLQSTTQQDSSSVLLNECPYTYACRQVLVDDRSKVQYFKLQENVNKIIIQGQHNTLVGIKSVVAIPYYDWNLDYIRPKPLCIRKNGKCLTSTYSIAPDSKKVEFENNAGEDYPTTRPPNAGDNTTEVIYLTDQVDISSKVPTPGTYVFVVHYYQPNHPESEMAAIIQNGEFYDAKLPISHCPSSSGCRSIVQQEDGNYNFTLTENFVLTLKESTGKGVWLDYVLVVRADLPIKDYLKEDTLDQTRDFITNCGQNHYHVDTTEKGFCRDAVFSLTSQYNNGALQCQCDVHGGAEALECDTYGGQCKCQPNVIGRTCKLCKTGYYGFPDCKPCDCPSTALCAEDGTCICPRNVDGERCDKCMALTYGFHPSVGCSECNCNALGVVSNQLQCDLLNGSCPCKPNIIGRVCDHCLPGHYAFPYCNQCDCDLRGTIDDICDPENAKCYCKENVIGHACDTCHDGHFDLQADNPVGCTKCFCFGKTKRCSSAELIWVEIVGMEDWYLVNLHIANNVSVYYHLNLPQQLKENVIGAELTTDEAMDKVVYFGAPRQYLGNRLTSYGGKLNYTIFYTTGLFGQAIDYADVVLQSGSDVFIRHTSIEQPPTTTYWNNSLQLIESNFVTANGGKVSRELLMTVLQDLKAIYIRATYWESSVTTRLQSVSLDVGLESWTENAVVATSIENCQCPSAYKGLSCEQCAEGHYRVSAGPHGGYCVPCRCNGHSNTCDVNTGVCLDCQHSTIGDHCEQCILGYHGNATNGGPNDCLICKCPLPLTSNNFAYSCDISENNSLISCQCQPGYTGARCESCAAGFYGEPEVEGDFCKPCNCSGNIIPEEPGSCDSVTGKCLKCVNNTFGEACNLCRTGYFGDAVILKNCQACICDRNGTDHCNSYTGLCQCLPGVVGDKCDRCADEHWGLSTGLGCQPCDCGIASESRQCQDEDGQCRCAKGVTGKRCESCARGYWNYSETGCESCNCTKGYSIGFACNAETGQCECLPGAIGEKCETCPYRWVLIPNEGCKECDSCSHNLLDSVNELNKTLSPIANDFKNKANSYFTTQRLVYIKQKIEKLEPEIAAFDPSQVDFILVTEEVELLENDAKNLDRKAEYGEKDGESLTNNAEALIKEATEVLSGVKKASNKAKSSVDYINDLATNLEVGESPRVDSAIAEAKQIVSDIKEKDLSPYMNVSNQQNNNAKRLLDRMTMFTEPVKLQNISFDYLRQNTQSFDNDLKDLLNYYAIAQQTAAKAEELNDKNRAAKVNSKVDTVNKQKKEADQNQIAAGQLILDATKSIENARDEIEKANDELSKLNNFNDILNETIQRNSDDSDEFDQLIDDADVYTKSLINKADILNNLLATLKNNSETRQAYIAASAYNSIVKEIEDARNSALLALNTTQTATNINKIITKNSRPALVNSTKLREDASTSLFTAQDELKPQLEEAEMAVHEIQDMNQKSEDANNAIIASIQGIPQMSMPPFIQNATDNSDKVNDTAREVISIMSELQETLPNSLIQAKNLPKDVDATIKSKAQIENQINKLNDLLPNITSLLDTVKYKQEQSEANRENAKANLEQLRKQIEMAKNLANRIKVGVQFEPSTTLELVTPDNVDEMGTSTHVSAYFRTQKPSGFLLYLGNPKGTKLRRTRSDDFMALEIENGFPSVTINIGNGIERINSDKYVADDKWYQIIVDRVGKNVKLTIREELNNRTEKEHVTERVLPGHNTIFNLDKDQSKLFVGGYPNNNKMQDDLRFSSFEGQIEELMIGDTPVGLWNFKEADGLLKGSRERNKLINIERSTSYKFSGEGYAIIDARPYINPENNLITLNFKTFASDGLLYLIGKDDSFLSIEMREGRVFMQFKLGGDTTTIGTLDTYNNGQWHEVTATRYKKTGELKVDGVKVDQSEANGDVTLLYTTDFMYFGGYPNSHNFKEVINQGFDGCIDSVIISSIPVDLNQYVIQALGITPGCKFASLVAFSDSTSFIRQPNASTSGHFQLTLKFKTANPEGLIFYSTDTYQTAGTSLSLVDGVLILKSQKEELIAGSNTYNDSQWHVVTAIHSESALRLVIDDYESYSTDGPPPPLVFMYGELFFGGVPRNYIITPGATATKTSFVGCLGDATINGQIIDFTSFKDKLGATIGRCAKINTIARAPHLSRPQVFPDYNIPGKIQPPVTAAPFTTERIPSTERATTTTPVPTQPPTTTSPAPPRTRKPAPKPEDGCGLGHGQISDEVDPDHGYRFGTRLESRIEFDRLPGRHSGEYDISVEISSDHFNGGLIFYGADKTHINFMALFMREGKVHIRYSCNNGTKSLVSPAACNDGQTHSISFIVNSNHAKLSIDDELVDENQSHCLYGMMPMDAPFYYGGMGNSTVILKNLEGQYSPFSGCLNNLRWGGQPVTEIGNKVNVIGCNSANEEKGIFFRPPGGYLKVMERYKVGTDMSISMEVKPRNSSGLLVSVHGRRDYLILEMVDNTVVLRVENGKGPFEAQFILSNKYLLCDGNWHKIHAIKSRNVVTVAVDGHFSEAGVGNSTSTDTKSALFIGGHPNLRKGVRGANTRKFYSGCLRNLSIKPRTYHEILPQNAHGNVLVGVCPLD